MPNKETSNYQRKKAITFDSYTHEMNDHIN